jgi:hypothetical protein
VLRERQLRAPKPRRTPGTGAPKTHAINAHGRRANGLYRSPPRPGNRAPTHATTSTYAQAKGRRGIVARLPRASRRRLRRLVPAGFIPAP